MKATPQSDEAFREQPLVVNVSKEGRMSVDEDDYFCK
jgi:hypothetical protein